MRNAYKKKIAELCEQNPKVMLVLVDSGDREYDELRERFAGRIVECGISEQNAVGVAAGIASEGMIPIIYGMSPFLVYRAFEFIRDDVCLQNMNVKIMGTGAGVIYNNLGPTHHATEDIGILRTVPDIRVLSPASPLELSPCIDSAIQHDGPTYIRIGKAWEEEIYEDIPGETIENAIELKEGNDICIISTGSITATVLKARALLKERNISTAIVNMRQLKPVNEQDIMSYLKKYKKVFTVEEHNIINGLGSVIADVIAKYNLDVNLGKIGFEDSFCRDYGWYQDIKKINGLGEEEIVDKILRILEDNK